ncbi:hypothetical protein C1708_28595 [Streptomyces sp. DH-12]|nr:hypothetical protein C1708_28595 [Streptomyces sp. DH-12]
MDGAPAPICHRAGTVSPPRRGEDLRLRAGRTARAGRLGVVQGAAVQAAQQVPGEGLAAPVADGAGGEPVAGDVDGVEGPAGAGSAGVQALRFGVDRREGGTGLLGDGARETRRHSLLPPLAHAALPGDRGPDPVPCSRDATSTIR